MAPQSKLFRDDPRLQACLTLDSAHVTKNATGGHVGKLQTALALLDGARVSAGGRWHRVGLDRDAADRVQRSDHRPYPRQLGLKRLGR